MVHNSDKDYSVDPITRKDLDDAFDRFEGNIKEHIDNLITPIKKDQGKTEIILTGATGLNGLVGRVKTLSTNLKVIYGLLVFICAAIFKEMFL